MAGPPAAPGAWEEVVSVREEADLERELLGRLGRASRIRSVGVTDLLSLRQAYYRAALPPVPIPPERQARLDQGRAAHRALGARMSREGILEARVRRDGLVGRIDILSDLPVEVKTTTALADPTRIASQRPDHVEQLGMYCALIGRPSGRLLTLLAEESAITDVQAVDLSFASPDRILDEMRRRAGVLREAWAEGSAARLPRCPWYGRGCEFEAARQCDCTGAEPSDSPAILEEAGAPVPNEEVRERVRTALSGSLRPSSEVRIQRFREVLYPRRAFFERTRPPAEEAPVPPAPVPPTVSLTPDLYARLSEALESGSPGEVSRIVPRSEEPEEEVTGFRGRPLLLRTSRAWSRFLPEALVARAPQYALELGLRCAVTGTDSGLLVVGFERAESERDQLQVLEVRFRSLTVFSRWLRTQSPALARALENDAPETLPPCPAWMVPDCPYRSECGCAGPGPRVTR